MTVKQMQCLLVYLGKTIDIDGIRGKQTEKALAEIKAEYGVDESGLVGIIAGTVPRLSKPKTFWDEIEYFTREDFRCQCGGKYCNGFPVEPEEKMVRTVDAIRRKLGKPIEIVRAGGSGVRCKVHNANVNGAANSNHLYGKAADLHANVTPAELKAAAEAVMGSTGGIGLYKWGVHVDTGAYSRWNG